MNAGLTNLIRLCQVDPEGHRELLVAMCRNAVEHDDWGVAVQRIADEGDAASRTSFATLVQACVADLGLDPLSGAELQDRAVAAQAQRLLAGEITERELTYWVFRVVGLRGTSRTQPFLDLESEYMRYAAYDCSSIDADVMSAARTFVQGPQNPPKRRGLFRRR